MLVVVNCGKRHDSPGGCDFPPGCVKNAVTVAMQGFIAGRHRPARPRLLFRWLAGAREMVPEVYPVRESPATVPAPNRFCGHLPV